jgi:GntR family transcriptional regulator
MPRAHTRSTPLHTQILRELRRHALTLPPGTPIPSERALAAEYRVSRMTAREAVRSLRAEGLVYPERGRGMFIAQQKTNVHAGSLSGFSTHVRSGGQQPSSRLLGFRRIDSTPSIADALALPVGTPVFLIERLRLADGKPMAYEAAHVPADLCATLYRYDLERDSLYRILREEHGIRFRRASEELEAATAGRAIGHLFRIPASDPVLIVRRIIYSTSDRPVEATTTTYRADRYRACFQFEVGD